MSEVMPRRVSKKIEIMVVDDHFVVRVGLRGSIDLESDMAVMWEASTGEQAVSMYRQNQPDLVLMDLNLPLASGIDATKAICNEFPDAAIIILSTHEGEEDIYQSFHAGAKGYIVKTAAREELINAIRVAAAGDRYIPAAIGARLAERMTHPDLTSREMEVLELIVAGKSNKEIASELSITEVTVKLHVGHLLTKLRVHDRTQAATTALQRGIIHID
ncbi:MAG TPA: response regulator transcription factor [Verrucomicrobiae bacterium]|nr:response regulator transcription factor [Verrucomicrobiae bacterium]